MKRVRWDGPVAVEQGVVRTRTGTLGEWRVRVAVYATGGFQQWRLVCRATAGERAVHFGHGVQAEGWQDAFRQALARLRRKLAVKD